MNFAEALEKLLGYAVRWRTKGGFLRIGILLLAIGWSLKALFSSDVWFAAFEAGITFVWWSTWLVGSGRVPLLHRAHIVAIAIDVEPDVERNWARLLRRLSEEMAALTLKAPMKLRRVAADLITDDPSAHSYVQRFGLEQLVWGTAEAGQKDSQRIHRFRLHYTQSFDRPVNLEAVASDAALLIRGRRWTISEINDLVDIDVLAEDFLEVAIGIIAINRFVQEQFEDAAQLFGRVVRGLSRQGDRAAPANQQRLQRFRTVYQTAAMRVALEAHASGDHGRAVTVIESLMPDLENNVDVLLTLARANYYLGDVKRAVEITYRVRDIDRDNPAVFVNLAFFAIARQQYDRAVKQYDRLLSSARDCKPILASVSSFLEERYHESPEEHGFLYGLAIVNGLPDPAVMMSDLASFMKATEGDKRYEPMRRRAAQLLEEGAAN